MDIKEQLYERLEKLGWTLYKLAKRFSELRAANGGEISSPMRYHTAIGKSMENPVKSKYETIEGIVQALGGELKIEWQSDKKTELVQAQAIDSSSSLAPYQIRFFLHDKFVGLTYSDTFINALNAAINFHCTSPDVFAEVWRVDEKLCSSADIEICQREQVRSHPVLEHSNSGYLVIRE